MTRNRILLTALLTSIVLAACGGGASQPSGDTQAVPAGGYTDISPRELETMLTEKDFFFVNVHIPYEGEITQTDAFVPFDQIEAQLAAFPADKDAKIVVYCRSGSMSAIAARELVRLGYTNVWNLDGGMIAWKAAGNELIQRDA